MREILHRLGGLALLLIGAIIPAHAEPVPGAGDPAYAAARDAWLTGDDAALGRLERLADTGNVAATILLARLLETATYSGNPIDGFGEPAALYARVRAKSPLADTFATMAALPRENEKIIELVRTLFELGEPALAYRLIVDIGTHLFYGLTVDFPQDVLAMGTDRSIDLVLRAVRLATMGGQFENEPRERVFSAYCQEQAETGAFAPFALICKAASIKERLDVGATLYSGEHPADPVVSAAVIDWLRAERAAYRRVCDAACPETPKACVLQVYELTTGGFGYSSLWSPVETLVPRSAYHGSGREALDLWRRLLGYAEHRDRYDGGIETDERLTAACLSDAIRAGAPPWK